MRGAGEAGGEGAVDRSVFVMNKSPLAGSATVVTTSREGWSEKGAQHWGVARAAWQLPYVPKYKQLSTRLLERKMNSVVFETCSMGHMFYNPHRQFAFTTILKITSTQRGYQMSSSTGM